MARHLDALVINTVQEIIKLTTWSAHRRKCFQKYLVEEYTSSELNTLWIHFLASFKYWNLKTLPSSISGIKRKCSHSVKNMKLISLFGLCNSKTQQFTSKTVTEGKGLDRLIRRFHLSCQCSALSQAIRKFILSIIVHCGERELWFTPHKAHSSQYPFWHQC